LDALVAELDVAGRLAQDPVSFPRRYPNPRDAEISGIFAASLAFGRVAAFRTVLDALHARMDAVGGPRAWLSDPDPGSLTYRWVRGPDLARLGEALFRVLGDDTVETVFARRFSPDHVDVGPALSGFVSDLLDALPPPRSHGLRSLLPSPADGSACKRWNLFLRWMIRPSTEGIDLGLWTRIPPSALVIPLDTHVLRIAGLLGLTTRTGTPSRGTRRSGGPSRGKPAAGAAGQQAGGLLAGLAGAGAPVARWASRTPEPGGQAKPCWGGGGQSGSWRTARAVTDALTRLDPVDPVRYDFALAHLGISGRCRRGQDPAACAGCGLVGVCYAERRAEEGP